MAEAPPSNKTPILFRPAILSVLSSSLNKSALVHLAIELPERLLATLNQLALNYFQETQIGFQENGQYLALQP